MFYFRWARQTSWRGSSAMAAGFTPRRLCSYLIGVRAILDYMSAKSSRKGSSFEREIAKKLSLWLSDNTRDDLLWRTAMSGGRATLHRQQGKSAVAQAGDLCSIDEASWWFTQKFFIETKHLKDLNLTSFVLRGQGPLAAHLKKASEEAMAEDKALFFVVRQNRFPTALILEDFLPKLPLQADIRGFYFYDLDRILENAPPSILRTEMFGKPWRDGL